MRSLRLLALSSLVAGLIVVLGSLGLWLALPLAWLWLGSQVQAASGSLAAALAAAMAGFLVSVAIALRLLRWLSAKHGSLREARGHEDYGTVLLEAVVFFSAVIAGIAFAIWFFLLSGTSPIPFRGEG